MPDPTGHQSGAASTTRRHRDELKTTDTATAPGKKAEQVTVIVPTRNSDRTLAACLRSVRSQTYPHVELIVVDNHSTDNTLDIAGRYADQVVTRGPERSAQRNHGAALASGKFLCFLDSDLMLEPQVVEHAVDVFRNDASYGGLVIPELAFGHGYLAACRALEKRLYLGDPNVEAARIFPAHAFHQVGGYNEEVTGGEDWDLPERIAAAGYHMGRVDAFAHHDEGTLRLRETFTKKRYYGHHSAGYLTQSHRGRRHFLRIALIAQPRRLLTQPHKAAGLAILKIVEAAGLVTGIITQPRQDRNRFR